MRPTVRLLAALCLCLPLPACHKGASGRTLVMVPKGVHPYYTPCFEGFKAAAEKRGAHAEMAAPEAFELPKQVKVLEDVVARQVDGIAISAMDDGGLVPVIHDAAKAGIKVLTFDSAAPSTEALSYIGTDNATAGFTAGQALAKALDGKGEVAVFQSGLDVPNLNERFAGFSKALKAYPGISVVAREDTEGKLETTVNKAETVLQAHPKLRALFGLSAEGAPGSAAVVKERKLSGILVAGFDDLPETLDYIRQGGVAFCVAQKTYLMGWISANDLLDALDGKTLPKVVDTGVLVVTKANVDSYQAEMRQQAAAGATGQP